MDLLFDSIQSAIALLLTRDPELLNIVWVSVKVSALSTVIASLAGIPGGFLIAYSEFYGKRLLLTCLNTLLALPTVVIGLLVYSFISRRGILGPMELLYTQKAIIIGQVILIVPLICSLTIAAISRIDTRYRKTALTLGATQKQMALVIIKEARYGIGAAVIAAFGRVIAEVGISMMLGGNAKGFTRTMTTAMALEYDKGEFVLSVALGLTLMSIAFAVNMLFHFFQGRTRVDAV
ncbi:ABC-type tungstate transport system, periplasmic component [Desulfocapsa sulfexigens DSM 10523]|uniref:ABC-type tungstate transport system, periplasmic component n=1 Tax=Desulfocapsa sulfexigens (strain DSM 10523 / SB164P1) TaxID=1167006 RepID=M1NJR3_DESSD|nr:ABC transporter permease [Desulfocapsa sulfexigens]AGF79819.1 ABC-type tungstate transport system, periplasmic component [Desulfocapsa sulfexigens DSM 10523]